jgi:type I restriction enzyme S subunit
MGEMLPRNWVSINLKESIDFRKGKKPKILSSEYFEGSVPYMDIQGLEKNIVSFYADSNSAKYFKDNDVVIVWDGSRSGLILKPKQGAIGSTLGALSPIGYNTQFLYYFLSTHYETINSKARGVGIPHVDPTYLWNLELPLPPLAEQERIVAKLDTLFAQHELMKKALERIPKLIKEFRQQVLTQAVLIEKGTKKLNKFLVDIKYGTSKKSEYGVDGIPILRIPNIVNGAVDNKDLKFTALEENEFNSLKLVENDILIIRSNGSISIVGRSAIVPKEFENYSFAGYLIRIRLNSEYNATYLNYIFKSNFIRSQMIDTSRSTSGVNNINSKEIQNLNIPAISIEKQLEIVRRLESLFAKADEIEARYQKLKEKINHLPQAILHKAFKGELVEQLPTDRDARDLLDEIKKLRKKLKK